MKREYLEQNPIIKHFLILKEFELSILCQSQKLKKTQQVLSHF